MESSEKGKCLIKAVSIQLAPRDKGKLFHEMAMMSSFPLQSNKNKISDSFRAE